VHLAEVRPGVVVDPVASCRHVECMARHIESNNKLFNMVSHKSDKLNPSSSRSSSSCLADSFRDHVEPKVSSDALDSEQSYKCCVDLFVL
jgi:hypothetical protein